MADVQYSPQWREQAEVPTVEPYGQHDRYAPPILAGSPAPIAPRPAPVLPTAAALDGVDLRTAPERLQTYCDALDRRVEVLEAAVSNQEMRMSLPLHAGKMAEQDHRLEQLERALLDAGHRISVLEHRVALLEDAEVRA